MKLKKLIMVACLASSAIAASVFSLQANALITTAEVTYYSDASKTTVVGFAFRNCQLKWSFFGQTTSYKDVVLEPCGA